MLTGIAIPVQATTADKPEPEQTSNKGASINDSFKRRDVVDRKLAGCQQEADRRQDRRGSRSGDHPHSVIFFECDKLLQLFSTNAIAHDAASDLIASAITHVASPCCAERPQQHDLRSAEDDSNAISTLQK